MFKFLPLLIVISLFTLSCDNTDISKPQVDLSTTQDNIVSEKAVSEVFVIVNTLPGYGLSKAAETNPTYLWSQNLLTITYPETGFIGNDGLSRKGVIKAQFNANFNGTWAVNDNVTITFENYYINGNNLTGTVVATCTQLDPGKIFHLVSENMMLTFSDSKSISWSTVVDYTMLAGGGTIDWSDDEWQIDGSNDGTARNGKTFSRTATGLKTSTECKYFVSGNLLIVINETDSYDIEFKPTCGNIVITYLGFPFTFNLE